MRTYVVKNVAKLRMSPLEIAADLLNDKAMNHGLGETARRKAVMSSTNRSRFCNRTKRTLTIAMVHPFGRLRDLIQKGEQAADKEAMDQNTITTDVVQA